MAEKIVLDSGVRVLLEPIEHLRSVCLGIWVAAGSRLEGPEEWGTAHFIEHMLFKGTRRRSAQQIASEIDAVGGVLNAFTSREYSSFYVKVMDEHLPLAVDLITDLYLESVFDPEELERERSVVLQEIRMVEDTPEEHVMDLLYKVMWKGSSMAHPVQGESRQVSRISRETLLDRWRDHYHHREALFSVAGRFQKEQLLRLLEGAGGSLCADPKWPKRRLPKSHAGIQLVKKDLEQVHVCLGVPAPSATHPGRYAYLLLNTILGGGMSSRLFQEVREKRGLAYSVYSFVNTYADAGVLGIYLGTTRDELHEALSVILDQMARLKEEPVSPEVLRSAREQVKGGLILGLESSDRRMGRQAQNELYFGREVSVEEVIQAMEEQTPESVRKAAQEAFQEKCICGVVLGNASGSDLPVALREMME
ncbi:MAG: M16 family metallopeptidase [Thermodesulfobacteriota bacterium]